VPLFGVRRLDAALPSFGRGRKLGTMPDWPHSPTHRLDEAGAYMVTAATYQKQPFFRSRRRLTYLCETLLNLAASQNWKLEAWAIFPNHYHFIATSPGSAQTLRQFIGHLHTVTAKELNRQDNTPGRRVWFQYWDSKLTFLRSYLARLNYVHTNAVRHGLTQQPEQYEWCSAGWFERTAERPFYRTVMQIRSDRVKILDDFEVDAVDVQ
jgi:REP-associated tyrosine transposase